MGCKDPGRPRESLDLQAGPSFCNPLAPSWANGRSEILLTYRIVASGDLRNDKFSGRNLAVRKPRELRRRAVAKARLSDEQRARGPEPASLGALTRLLGRGQC